MFDDAYPSVRSIRSARRRRPRGDLMALTAAAAIAVGALPRFPAAPDTASPSSQRADTPPAAAQAAAPAAPGRYAWLLDPTPALGARTQALRQTADLASAFEPEIAPPPAIVAALVEREPAQTPRPLAVQQTARLSQTVPLPVPRPAELRRPPAAIVARLADRPLTPATAAARRNEEADRSFFDTVFGAKPAPSGPALAYAGVDTDGLGLTKGRSRGPVAAPQAGMGTAVYDISAARVTLPSGEVLEAHSGLGASMDNPNGVHLRMRGSTPPGTYDLTEREALFHGVRALRLNPVGGPSAIHNRNGLLTHTYMLGSSGASNGCISFRNYNRFLQAYLSGEVRRVVVVAGARQDGFPSFAGRLFGRSAEAE